MQEKLRGRQRARTLTARSEISTGLPASRFLPSHFWLILVSALLPRACLQVSQLRWSRTHTHTLLLWGYSCCQRSSAGTLSLSRIRNKSKVFYFVFPLYHRKSHRHVFENEDHNVRMKYLNPQRIFTWTRGRSSCSLRLWSHSHFISAAVRLRLTETL